MTIAELIDRKQQERKDLVELDANVQHYLRLSEQIDTLWAAAELLATAEEEERQALARKANRRKTKKELEEEVFVRAADDLPELPVDSEDGQSLDE